MLREKNLTLLAEKLLLAINDTNPVELRIVDLKDLKKSLKNILDAYDALEHEFYSLM